MKSNFLLGAVIGATIIAVVTIIAIAVYETIDHNDKQPEIEPPKYWHLEGMQYNDIDTQFKELKRMLKELDMSHNELMNSSRHLKHNRIERHKLTIQYMQARSQILLNIYQVIFLVK